MKKIILTFAMAFLCAVAYPKSIDSLKRKIAKVEKIRCNGKSACLQNKKKQKALIRKMGRCGTIKRSSIAPAQAVNIIFVPSGFHGDKIKFYEEVLNISKTFDKYPPLNKNNQLINTMMSLKENPRNSHCSFNCQGIDRVLCCDTTAAKSQASACGEFENQQVIVVHNSKKYGGAGYIGANVATTSIHPDAPVVAVHELGHSLFELSDEYVQSVGNISDKNCEQAGCSQWRDLIEDGVKGASCTPNGCAGGNSYTCGTTVMKALTDDFGVNNERLACCTFKNITSQYPSYCAKFNNVGMGLDNFCADYPQIYSKSQKSKSSEVPEVRKEFY